MSKMSPFHEMTSALCQSMRWKDWAGYFAVNSYDFSHDSEYAAIRYAVGLMDVTPLYKYDLKGKDSLEALNRIVTKNLLKLSVGQVTYCCWVDEYGKMLDDGTITRLGENHFQITAAEPSFYWISKYLEGYDAVLKDVTEDIGALALQGPYSRDLLVNLCGESVNEIKFFWSQRAKINNVAVLITRTGYTGDLGYEIWVENEQAKEVYQAIYTEGKKFAIQPFGIDALDVARIEAGFVMNGVDYHSANHCITESKKQSPFELGLGWTVNIDDNNPFIGMAALKAEKQKGSAYSFVGLVLDWDEQEKLFAKYGLPPQICGQAWRSSVPIYSSDGEQVGYATCGAWSPILKQNLALASIQSDYSQVGNDLYIEYTVEHVRHRVKAKVTKTPFFDPPRKRDNL